MSCKKNLTHSFIKEKVHVPLPCWSEYSWAVKLSRWDVSGNKNVRVIKHSKEKKMPGALNVKHPPLAMWLLALLWLTFMHLTRSVPSFKKKKKKTKVHLRILYRIVLFDHFEPKIESGVLAFHLGNSITGKGKFWKENNKTLKTSLSILHTRQQNKTFLFLFEKKNTQT